MKLSETLKERGYVYQFSSEKLEEITDGEQRTFYLGVDPTADSMHVGQLQGILVLRRFIEAGHRLIILIGGGTGMVGDPGGKSEERNLLPDETIDKNAEALRAQFSQLFGGADFDMVNNAQWLRSANLMEFLRDIGKNFTVNEMIKRDSIRPRLETPDASISFTEFSYMLLQAYDYLYLNQNHNCTLQVGGSDQWGNIVSGVDLIRRKTGNAAYAFSWPLLVNKSTGKKFGKSEKGTVWLDAKKTSPFEFYQFWFNTEDDQVEEFLLKMTLLEKSEIDKVMFEHKKNPSERIAQKRLAQEVTRLVHGQGGLREAEKNTETLFIRVAEEIGVQDVVSISVCEVSEGANLADVLIQADLADSKREARQFIESGAISINDRAVKDVEYKITKEANPSDYLRLKRGKQNSRIVKIV